MGPFCNWKLICFPSHAKTRRKFATSHLFRFKNSTFDWLSLFFGSSSNIKSNRDSVHPITTLNSACFTCRPHLSICNHLWFLHMDTNALNNCIQLGDVPENHPHLRLSMTSNPHGSGSKRYYGPSANITIFRQVRFGTITAIHPAKSCHVSITRSLEPYRRCRMGRTTPVTAIRGFKSAGVTAGLRWTSFNLSSYVYVQLLLNPNIHENLYAKTGTSGIIQRLAVTVTVLHIFPSFLLRSTTPTLLSVTTRVH
jgi:hypothetical protein